MDSPRKVAPYDRCDYRCDSCIHFKKCRLFQQEAEQMALENRHEKIQHVLMNVKRSLVETLNTLHQKATELGLEFQDARRSSFQEIPTPESFPLYRMAYHFTRRAHKFLQDYWGKEPSKAEVRILKTELDDLSWHHTLISVKLARALISQNDGDDFGLLDARNSVQVALSSLQICRFALGNIIEQYNDYFDEAIELILLLNKIEEAIHNQFKLESVNKF